MSPDDIKGCLDLVEKHRDKAQPQLGKFGLTPEQFRKYCDGREVSFEPRGKGGHRARPDATRTAAVSSDSEYGKRLRAMGCEPIVAPSFICEVTPRLAQLWLANNEGNRRPSAAKVKRYAAMMRDNVWDLNGETVKFSRSGRLLDGQSRLQAVVMAGKTVTLELRFGLEDLHQETMDSGELRSIGNTLQMRGESDYCNMAAALRTLHLYINGGLVPSAVRATTSRPALYFGNRQALALLAKHPELRSWVRAAQQPMLKRFCPPSRLGCLLYVFSRIDPVAAAAFRDGLAKGEGLVSFSPILALRQRLEIALGEEKMPVAAKLVLVVKAWNAHRAGERLSVLRVTKGESFPAVSGCVLRAPAGEGEQ